MSGVKIEWRTEDMMRAMITVEGKGSRWWRRRWIVAEVVRVPSERPEIASYANWQFVIGGDRVCDHDDDLAQEIERRMRDDIYWRNKAEQRAKLKNPWEEARPLPPANTVKR